MISLAAHRRALPPGFLGLSTVVRLRILGGREAPRRHVSYYSVIPRNISLDSPREFLQMALQCRRHKHAAVLHKVNLPELRL